MAALLITLLGTASQAQDQRPDPFGDDLVQKILMLALDNMSRARCEDMKPCAPATAAEKANPPITVAEARMIVHRGTLSGTAERCGLDWRKRNFEPMMAYWRQKMKKNERQMALIGLMHGIMQGMVEGNRKLSCTAEIREGLERQLTFQP